MRKARGKDFYIAWSTSVVGSALYAVFSTTTPIGLAVAAGQIAGSGITLALLWSMSDDA